MRPSGTRTCVCLSLSRMILSFAHGRRPDHLSSLSLVSKGLLSVEELLQRQHLQGLLRRCTTGGPLSSGTGSRALPLSLSLSSSAMAAGSASELLFWPLNPHLVSLSKNLQHKWALLYPSCSGGRQDMFMYQRIFRKYQMFLKNISKNKRDILEKR